MVLRGRGGEGGADGLHHFCASAGLAELQELLGGAEILLRGGDGGREEQMGIAGEGDEVEGIAGVQRVQRGGHGFFGFFEREAVHGAGGIDDEDEFLRGDVGGLGLFGGREEEGEVAEGVDAVGEEGVFDRGAGDFIAKNEVFVGDFLLVAEGEAGRGGDDFMGRGVELFGSVHVYV